MNKQHLKNNKLYKKKQIQQMCSKLGDRENVPQNEYKIYEI